METFDIVLDKCKYLIIISFFIGIIGFFMLYFYKHLSFKNKKLRNVGLIFFGQTFIIGFSIIILNFIFVKIVEKRFIKFLNNKDIVMSINDSLINKNKCDSIVVELKRVYNFMHQHTSPTITIKMKLKNKDKIYNLELKKDSKFDDVYWIYVTNYIKTSEWDIGQIKTRQFDNFEFK